MEKIGRVANVARRVPADNLIERVNFAVELRHAAEDVDIEGNLGEKP